jgi:hypothetical protein
LARGNPDQERPFPLEKGRQQLYYMRNPSVASRSQLSESTVPSLITISTKRSNFYIRPPQNASLSIKISSTILLHLLKTSNVPASSLPQKMALVRAFYSSTIMAVNELWGNAHLLFGQSSIFTVPSGSIIGLLKEHSVSVFSLVLR